MSDIISLVQGPGALYWGFVPFLIESFPYDLTELGTYSQLSDMKERAVAKSSSQKGWVTQVPDQVGEELLTLPMNCVSCFCPQLLGCHDYGS